MKYDIVLAGVGGQGILTIAYLLDNAAVNKGLRFKQAEVHGMAQRGGAVYSHMRISDEEIISDLIPEGRADMILSVEPLEVQRYLAFLAPEGVVVSNNQTFVNISDYPDEEAVINAVLELPNAVMFNARAIAMAHKAPRAQNVATVGAATPFLPFSVEDFEPIIRGLFEKKGEKVVETNLAVLRDAHNAGMFYKKLLDSGVPNSSIYCLVRKLVVTSYDPELAPAFAEVLKANSKKATDYLCALEEPVLCDQELVQKLS